MGRKAAIVSAEGGETPCMQMSKCDCEGVGGVFLREFRERKESHDHSLHIAFCGAAATGQGLFDACRRVFCGVQRMFGAGFDHNAAGVTEDQGGFGVFEEKDTFHRRLIRIPLFDVFGKGFPDMDEAFAQGAVGGVSDRAQIEAALRPAVRFENCDSGRAQRGIDAEDAERFFRRRA